MTLYRVQTHPDTEPVLYLAAAGVVTEDADKALGWLEIDNATEVLVASSVCRGHDREFVVHAFEETTPEADGPSAETERDWAKEDAAVGEAQRAEADTHTQAEAGTAEGAGAPNPATEVTEGEPEPEPEPDATKPEPEVTPTGSGPASN